MSITTSNIFSAKVVFTISTSVLSAAILLSATDIADYAPWIYNGVVSWLRPPYLYLVTNCIIITIVASSKLQSERDDGAREHPHIAQLLNLNAVQTAQQLPIEIDETKFPMSLAAEYEFEGVERGLESDELDSGGIGGVSEYSTPEIVNGAEDAMCNKENECVPVAKSMWSAAEIIDGANFVKPPASARFGHRRNLKASNEGGRTVLGVSKPKKQDTLENTWKTITEGRAIPISRHLKKSETWTERQQENTPPPTMRKAETFKERSPMNGGSGKPRKEASLSQDELHRRVEAFIKKFNEDMRLQRQESLNQYTEMIN
ncbi:hypothetical protein SASPL_144345 [Salvia splendens]|uniref:DUF4408 domain-containing protein n=1 Tax=Salvia splendens TaxID=180675 RepID=A0A8X8WGS0_SALSN|nr:uncharacterized protein LOC121775506 [Salvia splendens]KAG6393774.1 hypothetical protein SASPL_144345 [Salvia splendens]